MVSVKILKVFVTTNLQGSQNGKQSGSFSQKKGYKNLFLHPEDRELNIEEPGDLHYLLSKVISSSYNQD